jgi:hypothetical protein
MFISRNQIVNKMIGDIERTLTNIVRDLIGVAAG